MNDKSIVWAFGILFMAVMCFLMFNFFDVRILIGKTAEAKGKIESIKVRAVRSGYVQDVRYVFNVEGMDYEGSTIVGNRNGPQQVGNSIDIKYLVRNPEMNKPVGFYKRVPKI